MTRARLAGGILALALLAPAPALATLGRSPLVTLRAGQVARAAPSAHARALMTVSAHRPLTGVRTVLPVLAHITTKHGTAWVRVALPGRPNGSSGWMVADRTLAESTPWRLTVDLSARRVTVFELGRVVRRFSAVVGAPSTPTPRGKFFVEEAMSLASRDPGGPFALATSARSDVLQEFDGGPGQIALHGTHHLAGALGTAASHGCIRMSDRAITWLARRIGPGVSVTIRR